MRRRSLMLAAVAVALALHVNAHAQRPRPARPPVPILDPGCESGRDDDRDSLDDGCEGQLLHDHAPVLFMPFPYDWIRPASVDWYLARVALRFHHNNCSDDAIAGVGAVNQQNLVTFRHRVKNGLPFCSHGGTVISSGSGPWRSSDHFFLQPPNDNVHKGSASPADWVVYGHAFPNTIGGVNLQYWFFYPYNDNFAAVNHESDWESIMVRLRANRSIDGVFFCLHGNCNTFRRPSQLSFLGRHVQAWVADGSHATYPSFAECENAPATAEAGGPNCSNRIGDRWFTWTGGRSGDLGHQGRGVINVGERGRPLNRQFFVDFGGGIWGERGETDTTSGKRTPSFQANWDQDRR